MVVSVVVSVVVMTRSCAPASLGAITWLVARPLPQRWSSGLQSTRRVGSMTALATAEPGFGPLLRSWRTNRRMSQLELASAAGVSARHLSFIETGRARPSREMVVHLAEQLDVPLRERNSLLAGAG